MHGACLNFVHFVLNLYPLYCRCQVSHKKIVEIFFDVVNIADYCLRILFKQIESALCRLILTVKPLEVYLTKQQFFQMVRETMKQV